jgi:nucleolar protein 56
LGVCDVKLANSISENTGIKCDTSDVIQELIRGVRQHFVRYIKEMTASGNTPSSFFTYPAFLLFLPLFCSSDLSQAQLGLGHSYSRSKVKFNVHREDNMIIQSISLLDQLDKDLNTFAMRVRYVYSLSPSFFCLASSSSFSFSSHSFLPSSLSEWYSWHFPELVRVVNENTQYCRLAKFIGDRNKLNADKKAGIAAILDGDEEKAQEILDASKLSMGTDISPVDLVSCLFFFLLLSLCLFSPFFDLVSRFFFAHLLSRSLFS